MNDNNDLLSGVKDLKDAFDGLTPAFNEMMGSLKGINKEFAELQGALNQVVSLFKKFTQLSGGSSSNGSNIVVPAAYRSKAYKAGHMRQTMVFNEPKLKLVGSRDFYDPRWAGGLSIPRMPGIQGLKQRFEDVYRNMQFVPGDLKAAFSQQMGLYTKLRMVKSWDGEKTVSQLKPDGLGSRHFDFLKNNKLTVGFGALGAALTVAVAAATMFSKKMRELSTGMFTSGASLGQVGRLSGLAGALGMSPAELGGRARSFGDLLTGGGVPGGLAAMIGINPYGGLGGDQNFFGKFQKALEYITNPNVDFNKASIMSRQFGMEDMMYLRFASPEMRRQALGATGMGSAEEMRKAADAQIQFNLTLKELTSTLMKLGQAVLPTLTLAMKNFGMVLTTTLAGGLIGLLLGGPAGGMVGMGIGAAGGLGLAAVFNNNTRATEIQTQAMEKNTATLNQFMKEGVYGGGERMRTAIPAAWGYSILEERALGIGRSLGAFTI